jgi:hypothetical protein
MSMPWFRMYAEVAGDPVIQSLAFEDQRHYFILLCLKCNGTLDRKIAPDHRERIITRGLGLDHVVAAEVKRRLAEVGLIDQKWQPKGWDKRQYQSDVSTDRVRKYRNNKDTGNVTETDRETVGNSFGNAPDTEQIQNTTDTEKKEHREVAEYIFSLIRKLNPKHREPKLNDWARDIRLMVERDHRTIEEIRALFEWANADEFWKTNILSPGTLRKQWDKLSIKKNNCGNGSTSNRSGRKTFADYRPKEPNDGRSDVIDTKSIRLD